MRLCCHNSCQLHPWKLSGSFAAAGFCLMHFWRPFGPLEFPPEFPVWISSSSVVNRPVLSSCCCGCWVGCGLLGFCVCGVGFLECRLEGCRDAAFFRVWVLGCVSLVGVWERKRFHTLILDIPFEAYARLRVFMGDLARKFCLLTTHLLQSRNWSSGLDLRLSNFSSSLGKVWRCYSDTCISLHCIFELPTAFSKQYQTSYSECSEWLLVLSSPRWVLRILARCAVESQA